VPRPSAKLCPACALSKPLYRRGCIDAAVSNRPGGVRFRTFWVLALRGPKTGRTIDLSGTGVESIRLAGQRAVETYEARSGVVILGFAWNRPGVAFARTFHLRRSLCAPAILSP
jgi:hypothetical protein